MTIIASKIVEVCVFTFENSNPLYLLLRRAKNERIYPDLWQFVSGSIEQDEKAVDAALRELKEETGFVPKAFWVVPHISTFYDPEWDSVNLSPVFAAQVDFGSTPKLSAEHGEFLWLPYDDAWKKLVWPAQREGLRIIHEYIVKGEEAGRRTRIR